MPRANDGPASEPRVEGCMFKKGRACALLALTLLALAWAPPAGAAGWTDWRHEGRELAAGLLARVLVGLGLTSHQGRGFKCDFGSSIDPNGCPKAGDSPVLKCDQGSSIDPNGCPKTSGDGSFWTPGTSA